MWSQVAALQTSCAELKTGQDDSYVPKVKMSLHDCTLKGVQLPANVNLPIVR